MSDSNQTNDEIEEQSKKATELYGENFKPRKKKIEKKVLFTRRNSILPPMKWKDKKII